MKGFFTQFGGFRNNGSQAAANSSCIAGNTSCNPDNDEQHFGKKVPMVNKNREKSIPFCCHCIGITTDEIELDTELPGIAARIPWPFPIYVVSIYLPNGKIPNFRNQLDDIIKKIPEPMVLIGDFNAHHRAWGSCNTNTHGSDIINLANKHDPTVLNDGSPTFIRGQSETAIDVSLASGKIG